VVRLDATGRRRSNASARHSSGGCDAAAEPRHVTGEMSIFNARLRVIEAAFEDLYDLKARLVHS
jgi:hypothetical protein